MAKLADAKAFSISENWAAMALQRIFRQPGARSMQEMVVIRYKLIDGRKIFGGT